MLASWPIGLVVKPTISLITNTLITYHTTAQYDIGAGVGDCQKPHSCLGLLHLYTEKEHI